MADAGEHDLSAAMFGEVGKRVRHLRVNRGLSMKQVSDLSGIDQGNLSRIETGKTTPSLETLRKIGRALEVDTQGLMFLLGEQIPPGKYLLNQSDVRTFDNSPTSAHFFKQLETSDYAPPTVHVSYVRVLADVSLAGWKAGDILVVTPIAAPQNKDIILVRAAGKIVPIRVNHWTWPFGPEKDKVSVYFDPLLPSLGMPALGDKDVVPVGTVVELRRVLNNKNVH